MHIQRTLRPSCIAFSFLAMPFLSGLGHADDGSLSYGGTPHLLTGHPSVIMQSEVVQMHIGKERTHVRCDFVFHNSGPACQVRMGFPDAGEGDSDLSRDDDKTPARGTFVSYSSVVDGHVIPTQVIRSADPSRVWHVKTVSFAAGAVRRVRDVYTVPTGSQTTSAPPEGGGLYLQSSYILYTGASWRGPIGQAVILVTFAPDVSPVPLRLVSLRSRPHRSLDGFVWRTHRPGTVVWDGPARPTIQGRTLRFVRRNWDPPVQDDVFLAFGWKPYSALSQTAPTDRRVLTARRVPVILAP